MPHDLTRTTTVPGASGAGRSTSSSSSLLKSCSTAAIILVIARSSSWKVSSYYARRSRAQRSGAESDSPDTGGPDSGIHLRRCVMKIRALLAPVLPLIGLLMLGGTPPSPRAAGFDWPQWQGVDRDGKSKETGLLATWPKEGPPLAWQATGLGDGF